MVISHISNTKGTWEKKKAFLSWGKHHEMLAVWLGLVLGGRGHFIQSLFSFDALHLGEATPMLTAVFRLCFFDCSPSYEHRTCFFFFGIALVLEVSLSVVIDLFCVSSAIVNVYLQHKQRKNSTPLHTEVS